MRTSSTRRRLAVTVGALTAAASMAPPVPAAGAGREVGPAGHPGTEVDVMIGTAGRPPWGHGGTTPAAATPFGMVQLGPDTTGDPEGGPSATPSGYAHDDPLLRGFSATHLSGAGCRAFGDVPVLPWVGDLPDAPGRATVPLDHGSETAGPGWYAVRLGSGVSVRLAAAPRAGLATLRFPAGQVPRLLVKASGSLAGVDEAAVTFPRRREVAVDATSGGFCGSPGRYRVHVLLRFDRPVAARGTWGGAAGQRVAGTAAETGAWVSFPRTTAQDRTVRVQVGVSFVDAAGARRNLADARLGWSSRAQQQRAAALWDRELSRLDLRGGTLEHRTAARTALYHALLHPSLLSDSDGRYPGLDGRVHRVPPGRRHYSAISGWDVYRQQLPLLAWLRPDVSSDVLRSLVRMGRQGGWVPRWPLVASETGVMNGDSGAPMIAALHAFGARDADLDEALALLVRQADDTDPAPGQGWFVPRPGLANYLRLGYVPNTEPERGWPRPHGASTTLEYAVDDFAIGRLARAQGREALAQRFAGRSGSWRSLLDTSRGLVLPRDAAGRFPEDDRAGACCDGFQEGNAEQYTLGGVPHDMGGLLAALGDEASVVARLDAFHQRLDAGAGSPHAWLGNQPSLLTPWAYLWLGRPDRTADVVARARAELWQASPGGLPGNDDLGSLSAWYLWAVLGLQPLVPGTADVGITPPVFDEVVVHPEGARPTRIVRRGSGPYVVGVTVDGRPGSASWLRWGPRSRPADLVVHTGDQPGRFGTAPEDRPRSFPSP